MLIKHTLTTKPHIKNPTPYDMHKIIMRNINNTQPLTPHEPRKDAAILWSHITDDIITIQHNNEVSLSLKDFHPIHQEEIHPATQPETLRLIGKVSRLYNPYIPLTQEERDIIAALGYNTSHIPQGTRKIPIPETDLHRVMENKLHQRNLQVLDLSCTISPDLHIKNSSKKVPTCMLMTTVTGSAEDINNLITQGFGKAKNYGLGLLHIKERKPQ